MNLARTLQALVVAAILVVGAAAPAHAQITEVEVGTSLVSLVIATDGGTTLLGVPSGGFGIINPTLYASLFAGDRLAIEPQLGLILVSGGGHTEHLFNLAGQVDYFLKGYRESSPFVFGSVGFINASGMGATPVSISGGGGYRQVLGDRLTLRFDGRFTHYTQGVGNSVAFTVSLGGVFRRE